MMDIDIELYCPELVHDIIMILYQNHELYKEYVLSQ